MGRFQILIYICICLFLGSCCVPILQKKFYTTEYGSDRPKNNKFKLAKNKINEDSNLLININKIYTRIDSSYFKHPKTKKTNLFVTKSFLRFFKSGKVIEGTTKNLSNGLKDYNDLKSGIIGYYKLNEDKITIEQFLVSSSDCGKYYQYELKIIGDSIVGYQKITVAGLKGTPDW